MQYQCCAVLCCAVLRDVLSRARRDKHKWRANHQAARSPRPHHQPRAEAQAETMSYMIIYALNTAAKPKHGASIHSRNATKCRNQALNKRQAESQWLFPLWFISAVSALVECIVTDKLCFCFFVCLLRCCAASSTGRSGLRLTGVSCADVSDEICRCATIDCHFQSRSLRVLNGFTQFGDSGARTATEASPHTSHTISPQQHTTHARHTNLANTASCSITTEQQRFNRAGHQVRGQRVCAERAPYNPTFVWLTLSQLLSRCLVQPECFTLSTRMGTSLVGISSGDALITACTQLPLLRRVLCVMSG